MIAYDGFRIAFDARGGELDFGPTAVVAFSLVLGLAFLVWGAVALRYLSALMADARAERRGRR